MEKIFYNGRLPPEFFSQIVFRSMRHTHQTKQDSGTVAPFSTYWLPARSRWEPGLDACRSHAMPLGKAKAGLSGQIHGMDAG
jgi:hypothetical protein